MVTTTDDKIDQFELAMLNSLNPVDCPLKHRFVPGMYIREIFMPKGSYVTSLVHNTTHPFFILQGKVSVFSENDGEQILEAPFTGITTPHTRRVIYIHEDCIWATCHATDIKPKDGSNEETLKAVDLIGEQILEKHENKLLGGHFVNNVFVPEQDKIEMNNIKQENNVIQYSY